MSMDAKTLKRARALLAMSEDTSSEHEAAIAMRRLHALLSKHNASVSSLDDKEDEVGKQYFESVDWPWRRNVLGMISELYFCKCYYTKTRKNYANYFVVGTDSNRMFATGIIESVIKTIEKEAVKNSKIARGKRDSTYISSFRNAAGMRIVKRCRELIEAAKRGTLEDENGSNLPMMLNVYDAHKNRNEDFLANFGLKSKSTKTRAHDMEATQDGRRAADKIQISRSLQGKNATLQIGGK